jgi:hypothetical protein
MRKVLLPLSFALAQVFAVSAMAQTKGGEVDPAQGKGVAGPKATAEQKAAAKADRSKDAAAISKATKTEADAAPGATGATKKATKEEKAAAAAKRKAEATAAVKKGEIKTGEK